MSRTKMITLAVLGIVALIHIIQNSQNVRVWILFFWKPEIPLVLVLAATFIAGGIIGLLVASHKRKAALPAAMADPDDRPDATPAD